MTKIVKNPKMASAGTISPKVAVPSLILFGLGAVLVILHVVLDDPGNTLLDLGLAAIGASGVTGAAGFASPVGRVLLPPTNGGAKPGPVAPGEPFSGA